MAKALRIVKSLDEAINAYGGVHKFARAFHYKDGKEIERWKEVGIIPAGAGLGLYVGLLQRGYEPHPQLFGMRSWQELLGA